MFFIAFGICFVFACFVAWMILFRSEREKVVRRAEIISAKMYTGIQRICRINSQNTAQAKASLRSKRLEVAQRMRQHYFLWVGALVLLVLPPLAALVFSNNLALEGFEDTGRDANVQVSELLKGELLVPPPPLPPEFFTSKEVELVRPMLVTASRNWQLLNGDFSQRLLLVFKIMKEKHGYDMAILEGYRSPERQNMLAAMGTNVTNAAAFQSYHQYGLAADCAFMRDGKLVISERDPWAMEGYRLYGEVAESVGLTWGGRWKMMDFGHTELRLPGVLKKS